MIEGATADQRWSQLETAFAAALDTPPEVRESLLRAHCADDSMRAEVRRLLARHDLLSASSGDAGDFLGRLDRERAAALFDQGRDPETIGRYEIEGRVGRGATGVVYLARDPLLGRRVALKLLAPHLSDRPEAVERFSEEARTASALDHPHIATIYEIGHTEAGRLFITMAYYEGETLRTRLARGPLPVDEAAMIASQLADALGAAHCSGIVHRDVKPENVVLTRRGARMVDFGLAKVARPGEQSAGVPRGTVAYMSPEQTRGDVGPGVDLWALGVVLYEMLAGVRPFPDDGTEVLFESIRHGTPTSLRLLRPDAPTGLVRVVERCLQKEPDLRYAAAGDIVSVLSSIKRRSGLRRHRVILAAGLLALGSAAALSMRPWNTATAPASSSAAPATIAVLPFTTVNPDSQHAYVTEGLTDALVEALAGTPGIRVASRQSVDRARQDGEDPRAIGLRVGVANVLHGTVTRRADGVRVTAHVLSTRDGSSIWAKTFDRGADEVLSLQNEIARALITTLKQRMGGGSVAPTLPPTTDPLAYDLYLRGRFLMQRRMPVDLEQASLLFQEAIARDPTFARAYVGLADVFMAVQAARPTDRYERAMPLLRHALALDSNLATGHRSAGWMTMWYDRDWSGAERHLRRALELDASDVWTHHFYAALLSATGRTKESLAMTRRAVVLDPLGARTTMHIGLHLFWNRRYEEAIAVLQHTLVLDSSFSRARGVLGRALLAAGRPEEALAQLRHERVEYGSFEPKALLAHALAATGSTGEARAILAQYEARSRTTYVSPVNLMAIYLGLGEINRALDWLERVPGDRGLMIFPISDPMYDVLRGMPRYERVLERLNLRS